MDLLGFAEIINKELVIRYYPRRKSPFSCYFEEGEIKETGFLVSAHGQGETPKTAMNNFVVQIQGQTLVFNAMSHQNRQEFQVPGNLTVPEN